MTSYIMLRKNMNFGALNNTNEDVTCQIRYSGGKLKNISSLSEYWWNTEWITSLHQSGRMKGWLSLLTTKEKWMKCQIHRQEDKVKLFFYYKD